ncbi:MAG: o-succinylbenzoate synthase [Bacteroidales bacterium]|jgi:o-succinylbenzoate synthase|nr:o-succinylbenzoate synthase [Bacteroidales bacterium]
MLKANFLHRPMIFKRPAGTSRGVLKTKDSWFIFIRDSADEDKVGIGEVSTITGLSIDPPDKIEAELQWLCNNISKTTDWINRRGQQFPAIRFGLETAFLDFKTNGNQVFEKNLFTEGKSGIPINGLIWMGNQDFMQTQVEEKIAAGFKCIKIKVGAIDFEQELKILAGIRAKFNAKQIELRLDANGAFSPNEAIDKLHRLSVYDIHSIEQPIKAGQTQEMAYLCENSPIPIALDEELIGVEPEGISLLLKEINPHYAILKPSLLGGLEAADRIIVEAEKLEIKWWATSALESNIGLNAIAQWVFKKQNPLPQGLGTGQLYTNNIQSPLEIKNAALFYNPALQWKNLSPK